MDVELIEIICCEVDINGEERIYWLTGEFDNEIEYKQ